MISLLDSSDAFCSFVGLFRVGRPEYEGFEESASVKGERKGGGRGGEGMPQDE